MKSAGSVAIPEDWHQFERNGQFSGMACACLGSQTACAFSRPPAKSSLGTKLQTCATSDQRTSNDVPMAPLEPAVFNFLPTEICKLPHQRNSLRPTVIFRQSSEIFLLMHRQSYFDNGQGLQFFDGSIDRLGPWEAVSVRRTSDPLANYSGEGTVVAVAGLAVTL